MVVLLVGRVRRTNRKTSEHRKLILLISFFEILQIQAASIEITKCNMSYIIFKSTSTLFFSYFRNSHTSTSTNNHHNHNTFCGYISLGYTNMRGSICVQLTAAGHPANKFHGKSFNNYTRYKIKPFSLSNKASRKTPAERNSLNHKIIIKLLTENIH